MSKAPFGLLFFPPPQHIRIGPSISHLVDFKSGSGIWAGWVQVILLPFKLVNSDIAADPETFELLKIAEK